MAGLKVDLEAQKAAMAKLGFLVGKWEGEARVYRSGDQSAILAMTEEAGFRQDGLLLLIEGTGRSKADDRVILQALGIISYDDAKGVYWMRAFNNGLFLESEVKLAEDGKGLSWGFMVEHVRTSSVLRINEHGEWTEEHEITIGEQPARKFMEVMVRKKG